MQIKNALPVESHDEEEIPIDEYLELERRGLLHLLEEEEANDDYPDLPPMTEKELAERTAFLAEANRKLEEKRKDLPSLKGIFDGLGDDDQEPPEDWPKF